MCCVESPGWQDCNSAVYCIERNEFGRFGTLFVRERCCQGELSLSGNDEECCPDALPIGAHRGHHVVLVQCPKMRQLRRRFNVEDLCENVVDFQRHAFLCCLLHILCHLGIPVLELGKQVLLPSTYRPHSILAMSFVFFLAAFAAFDWRHSHLSVSHEGTGPRNIM